MFDVGILLPCNMMRQLQGWPNKETCDANCLVARGCPCLVTGVYVLDHLQKQFSETLRSFLLWIAARKRNNFERKNGITEIKDKQTTR